MRTDPVRSPSRPYNHAHVGPPPGTRLGVYEVTEQIGEGGMGQVFRARDTRLDRDVAIKVPPETFARDAERLARFTREAKTLASLNHPHIAGIYGLEESAGVTALVMELVEGEDLSQRIARGVIPLRYSCLIALRRGSDCMRSSAANSQARQPDPRRLRCGTMTGWPSESNRSAL